MRAALDVLDGGVLLVSFFVICTSIGSMRDTYHRRQARLRAFARAEERRRREVNAAWHALFAAPPPYQPARRPYDWEADPDLTTREQVPCPPSP